jgi:1-pyrroline-4-hydroxy-2-carboxylate deaminase
VWQGVIPAVTTKFDENGNLDFKEMERCYRLQIQQAAGDKPALLTIAEAATRDACRLAERAARAGASGLMVVPSTIYHTNRAETLAALRAVAEAADLPIMVYSNRLAYRVDVTNDMLLELSEDKRFVAVKESSDDLRRTTEAVALLGDRMAVFTGVDNYAYEALAVGAVGWIAGLVTAFPKETVAIYRLMMHKRYDEALTLYRWFRPLLDLDVSTYLVQNIKLAEALAIGSNERVRLPRQPLAGELRAHVESVIKTALATRPDLPSL